MPKPDFFRYGRDEGAPAAPSAASASAVSASAAHTPPSPSSARPAGAEAGRAILAELTDEEWEKFIGFTARRRYPDGAVIVEAGARDVALGFVASGAVQVQAAAGRAATSRGEGEAFCILNFLDGAASEVTVSARGSAEVLLLGREALVQLAAWQPRIAVALLRDLGAHVAARLRKVQGGD